MDIISSCFKINEKSISASDSLEKVICFLSGGNKFVFKKAPKGPNGLPSLESSFNEIVVSNIAQYLKIDCIRTHMACLNDDNNKFKDKYGIMMEDYNESECKAFLGSYFLDYYYECLKEAGKLNELSQLDKQDALECMNNLQTIHDALSYYFEYLDKRDIIINKIMDEMSKRFCFDYMMMQSDRHMNNWAILISPLYGPRMAKMFDNELSFDLDFIPRMKFSNIDESKEETLIKFIRSGKKYEEMFLEMYRDLDVETFKSLIDETERINGNFPSNMYKINLIKKYEKNYKKITELLNRLGLLERESHAR